MYMARALNNMWNKNMTSGHVAVRRIAHWPAPNTYIDAIDVYGAGLVRVSGWSLKPASEVLSVVDLEVDGHRVENCQVFRTFRPDVRMIMGGADDYRGIAIEFTLPPERVQTITLRMPSRTLNFDAGELGVTFFDAPYRSLWQQDQVLRREHIYGYGPPSNETSLDVLSAATTLSGTVLDFGCGNGALLRQLRARGLPVEGLELDRPEIRDCLAEDVKPYITLYSGNLPSPYAAKSFDCVVAVEVIEHLPELLPAIAELARLARKEVLLTTPDIGAVPLLSAENVVPWHLLESTHLNFFTQSSLQRLLSDYFGEIEFGRVGRNTINKTHYWTSLLVWCRQPIDAV
jgi:2-polyprenyl-3-methyl-5-hydroxy-6-metoxy-1,4-benzoquinol methylase